MRRRRKVRRNRARQTGVLIALFLAFQPGKGNHARGMAPAICPSMTPRSHLLVMLPHHRAQPLQGRFDFHDKTSSYTTLVLLCFLFPLLLFYFFLHFSVSLLSFLKCEYSLKFCPQHFFFPLLISFFFSHRSNCHI